MCFNPEKCEVLRVTRRTKNVIQSSYYIRNTALKLVSSAKYLGVIIDSILTLTNTLTTSVKRRTPLEHLFIEIQKTVRWRSRLSHIKLWYDLNWGMHLQCRLLIRTVTLTVLKQFSVGLQDPQWKTGVDQVTNQQYLEQHILLWEEAHHLWYST